MVLISGRFTLFHLNRGRTSAFYQLMEFYSTNRDDTEETISAYIVIV